MMLELPVGVWVGGLVAGTGLLAVVVWRRPPPILVRLRGLCWTEQQLCQHFLITGATGAGKTRSGLVVLLLELFRRSRSFGGLFVDAKGVLHETVREIADRAGRGGDLIVLQVGNPAGPRFNLVGDRTVSFSTLARCVVDTAVAQGNRSEQSFFRSAAQLHIARALEALHVAGCAVTLENVHNVLVNPDDTRALLARLEAGELADHFRQYLAQPSEQLGGVIGTVRNYLHPFAQPEIAAVFCRDSTFELRDVDRGRLVCIAMPQRLQTERRFVGTFLKLLFYNHALARFDLPAAERARCNLLVLLVDECQQFVTASEHGMGDHNVVDLIREARVAVIAATQSTTSLLPVLGAEQARVFILNLRNRMIFAAADESDAKTSADAVGRHWRWEISWTRQGDRTSSTRRRVDEHRLKPHELVGLRKHQCLVVHAEYGHRRITLPPREADGRISPWYRWRWLRG